MVGETLRGSAAEERPAIRRGTVQLNVEWVKKPSHLSDQPLEQKAGRLIEPRHSERSKELIDDCYLT